MARASGDLIASRLRGGARTSSPTTPSQPGRVIRIVVLCSDALPSTLMGGLHEDRALVCSGRFRDGCSWRFGRRERRAFGRGGAPRPAGATRDALVVVELGGVRVVQPHVL